jgi:trehalose-6-phosphate synthase
LRREVFELAAKINKEFNAKIVILQEENPSLEKRLALWKKADLFLSSSLRDGISLQPTEYVLVKKLNK